MHAFSHSLEAWPTSFRLSSWRWLSRFIGLLLITTALLKLDALRTGSMSVDPILHSNRAVIGIVMMEMTLASWLLIASFRGGLECSVGWRAWDSSRLPSWSPF